MGFFSDLEEATPQKTGELSKKGRFFADLDERPSRSRSLLSAFPKGVIKGAHSLTKLTDPLAFFTGSEPSKMESQALETVLPTQKGRFAEEALETAGEMAPGFALGPESLLLKAGQVGTGALSKQILKEFGAPEIIQDLGSAALSLSPQGIKGALSKKILPTKSQKTAYDLLKSHGFSDKEITPFIQNKKKVDLLAKWSKPFLKREQLSQGLSDIGEAAYGAIQEKGKELPGLSGLKKIAFRQQFEKQYEKIPYFHRELIEKDASRLLSSELKWGDLRDFELAVNNKIKATEGGKEVLGSLKGPVKFAEKSISPELFREKETVNSIYKSGKDFLKKIKKTDFDHLKNLGSMGGIAYSLLSGNPFLAKGAAATVGAKFAAAKFLTSPRFQNMRAKLLEAVKKNNKSAILNLSVKMLEDLDRFSKLDKGIEKEESP